MSAPGTSGYDYDEAFSRNIGLLSEEEQARVRAARVAVAGLGGVGGNHVLALARTCAFSPTASQGRTSATSSTARWRPWTVSIFSIWTRGVCYFVRPEPAA